MKRIWIVVAVLAVLVIGGVAGWYFFLRSDAPDKFTIDTVTSASAAPSNPTAGIDGVWKVGTSVDGKPSEAGYRVSERFVGGAANVEAVGRTSGVTGSMTITGTQVTAVAVTADTTKLKSDKDRRDNALRANGLQTAQFPTASFALTSPIDLGAQTQTAKTNAAGTLTLHGQTRPVTVAVEATRVGDRIVVVGSTPITMADYGISPPSIPGFVSVESSGTLEFQLFFVRA